MYGNVTSQGVAGHLATAWHNNGYQGAGVKVGIIDSGFRGWRSLQGVELPSAVAGVRCYSDRDGNYGGLEVCDDPDWSRHGAAVGETVIDVAPEATLYLADPWTWGDLQNVVQWMVSEGVQVINMSLGYTFDGPGDGTYYYTNSPLNAVDDAVSGGIAWVVSAGNAARATWYGAFADTNDSDGWHEWEGTDESQDITLYEGERIIIQLRWDDQWGGANTDLDLYIDPDSDDYPAVSSTDRQQGGTDDIPFEGLPTRSPQTGDMIFG